MQLQNEAFMETWGTIKRSAYNRKKTFRTVQTKNWPRFYYCSYQVKNLSKFFRLSVNLQSKFSGRYQDQSDRSFSLQQSWLVHDVEKHWPKERCCFTRTRFCYSDDVAACHDCRNRLCLKIIWLWQLSWTVNVSSINLIKSVPSFDLT